MKEQISLQLTSFADDHGWIHDNLETLLKTYPDQWIAVKDRQVVASAPDFQELVSKLPDPAHTCVEFITRDPLEMVL